jgi:hypothetical protein
MPALIASQANYRQGACAPTEEILFWRDQLATKPVRCLSGTHGVTELHRRLNLVRATMAFKGPKVVTSWPWRDTSQRHFALAVRAGYLLQLGHGAPSNNRAGAQHSQSPVDTRHGTMMKRFRALTFNACMFQIAHLKTIATSLPNQMKVKPFKYNKFKGEWLAAG